jgi:hypothetical protein
VAAQARPAWTVVAPEAGEADEAAAATLEVDGVTARLAYLESKATGGVLRTTLRHADLGLGLAVTPGSTTRHLFWRDVEIGVPAWDRAHHVRARDGEQVRDYLRRLAPALAAVPGRAGALGRPRRHHRRAVRRGEYAAPGGGDAAGRGAGGATGARARAATARRATWRSTGTSGARWPASSTPASRRATPRSTARSTARRCTPACAGPTMATLRDLRVWVGDAASASALARATVLSLPAPAAGALATGVPPALTELLLGWPDDHVDLDLRGGVASASLRLVPGPDGRAVVSADATIELARRLRTLLAALGAERTPFR